MIEERVHIDRSPLDVFAFFDRPRNVQRVTPKTIAVSLESHPEDLRLGTIFAYSLKRWPVDFAWDVVVSEYEPPLRTVAEIIWVRLFWNGGFGMSHSGKGSSHLTRLRWRPLTGTTLPSA